MRLFILTTSLLALCTFSFEVRAEENDCVPAKIAACFVRKTAQGDCKTRERRPECQAECRAEAFRACGGDSNEGSADEE